MEKGGKFKRYLEKLFKEIDRDMDSLEQLCQEDKGKEIEKLIDRMIYKQSEGGKVFYAEVFLMTENTFKILELLKNFIV